MNKKIKIIELLNKIANGEELPKSIKYYGFIWQLHNGNYVENGQRMLEDYLANGIVESLNDYVEILEDNTEDIEELPDYNYSIKENRDKINEIIRYIKRKDKNKWLNYVNVVVKDIYAKK